MRHTARVSIYLQYTVVACNTCEETGLWGSTSIHLITTHLPRIRVDVAGLLDSRLGASTRGGGVPKEILSGVSLQRQVGVRVQGVCNGCKPIAVRFFRRQTLTSGRLGGPTKTSDAGAIVARHGVNIRLRANRLPLQAGVL